VLFIGNNFVVVFHVLNDDRLDDAVGMDRMGECVEFCFVYCGVLLNCWGFAISVFCWECAFILECPNCSVSLIVHKAVRCLLMLWVWLFSS